MIIDFKVSRVLEPTWNHVLHWIYLFIDLHFCIVICSLLHLVVTRIYLKGFIL